MTDTTVDAVSVVVAEVRGDGPTHDAPPAAGGRTRAATGLIRPLACVTDAGALLTAAVAAGGARPLVVVQCAVVFLWLRRLPAVRATSVSIIPGLDRIIGRTAFVTFVAVTAAPAAAATTTRAAIVGMALLTLGRAAAGGSVRAARRLGWDVEPTIVVGAGPSSVSLAASLLARPEHGLRPIGLVDSVDLPATGPLPLLGTVDDLDGILATSGVSRLVIAYGCLRDADLVDALRRCPPDVEIYVVPRLFELAAVCDVALSDVWGTPLARVERGSSQRSAATTKRAFDIGVAAVVLAATAPLLVTIAAAVAVTSGRPVLFRQCRIGRHGRPFQILKFRTMAVNGDGDRTWCVDDDERVTRLGRVLRATSLDELPQLVNVLRGDMSLVGPRPERPAFVERFSSSVPGYRDRHRVAAGITGLAQIHGLRGDTSIEERARFDNRYIDGWSIRADILILCQTLGAVVATALASIHRRGGDQA